MQSTYARDVLVVRRTWRAQAISLLGPLTIAAGFVWAIAQPYRITLLHPHHQGFWWLAVEAPLLVVFAGLFFAFVIARPLLADLEEAHGTAR
ncbi:MAG TPA: hypothetical protein VGH52_03235 [Gaiellaceae bacterium]|jgi:hypothetical protein